MENSPDIMAISGALRRIRKTVQILKQTQPGPGIRPHINHPNFHTCGDLLGGRGHQLCSMAPGGGFGQIFAAPARFGQSHPGAPARAMPAADRAIPVAAAPCAAMPRRLLLIVAPFPQIIGDKQARPLHHAHAPPNQMTQLMKGGGWDGNPLA